MRNIIHRGIGRIRKEIFVKQFLRFDISSGLGSDGVGNGCSISGAERISVGKDCFFGEGTELTALGNHFSQKLNSHLSIGNHVRCVGGCRITCAGSIMLEDDVLLGPEVFITDHNHGMDPYYPGGYSKQPLIVKDVHVGQGAWLGQRVCVMPGVTVGAHSIIGASSVVTHDIPPYTIAVGSPAKVVKVWNAGTDCWEPVKNRE